MLATVTIPMIELAQLVEAELRGQYEIGSIVGSICQRAIGWHLRSDSKVDCLPIPRSHFERSRQKLAK